MTDSLRRSSLFIHYIYSIKRPEYGILTVIFMIVKQQLVPNVPTINGCKMRITGTPNSLPAVTALSQPSRLTRTLRLRFSKSCHANSSSRAILYSLAFASTIRLIAACSLPARKTQAKRIFAISVDDTVTGTN